ncbi:MAG: hypothetical protein M1821_000395 [Bathelium mastoideum]|nr:MAG: hypothetical protein M1821_000395 [Bathelium mastoideum]
MQLVGPVVWVVAALTLWLGWAGVVIIYRLYFHPLARFPGPKLAAATYLYAQYYDLWLGGQYVFKLKELHDRYGPVVRFMPDDLHFNDPDYFDEIYTTAGKPGKPFKWANAFGPYPAAIGTVDHNLHRMRRGAVNPYFSKQSVNQITPFLIPIIEKLCARFEAASRTGERINLKYAYAALALDNMWEYCFSRTPDRVLWPDFDKRGFDNIDSFVDTSLVNIYYPWLMAWIYKVPEPWLKVIMPAMKEIVDEREALANQIETIRDGKDTAAAKSGHKTIFHDLLASDLPQQEKSRNRLRDEAFSLVTAGSGTTAYSLKCISYYIQANPIVHQKLFNELKIAMPRRLDVPRLADLEKLPYLSAVIYEGLRISHPVTHRNMRYFPQKSLIYNNIPIPPGTIVAMSAVLLHENPEVFPEPRVFKPERWLESEEEKQRLQRRFVVFSRGTRGCLGMNLAWGELFLILAMIFRRFEFDLNQVNKERDVDLDRDLILGVPKKESKGVVVGVKCTED